MGRDHSPGGQPLDLLDPGWLDRTLATLLALSGALNVAWLSLGNGPAAARIVVGASIAGIAAAVWLLLVRPPRDLRLFLTATLLACGVLITVQTAVAGPTSSPFALYYLWLAPFSFLVWDLRRAAAYVTVLGLGFAGVLAAHSGADLAHFATEDLPALLVGIGGIVVVGWTLRAVCAQLARRHADAERSVAAQDALTRLARRALAPEGGADGTLVRCAEQVVRTSLDADGVAIDLTGGTIDVERAGRELDEDERAFVSGVADVLALAAARESAERRRVDEAGRDALTGLPGRERFAADLGERVAAGGTLMLLDIEGFGVVNETLGPRGGDVLLRSVVGRVADALPQHALLARVGGSELAVFDAELHGEVAAFVLARRLQDALKAPFDLDGVTHHGSLGIGIVVCAPGRYAEERTAIRDAHVARRRARERGRGRFELFDERAALELEQRRCLEQDLRLALKRREFRLVFQPIVDLEDGRVTGAETLVRWEHPERGLVGPGEFIEAAEQTDLIVPLGDWILREACRQLVAWRAGSDDFDDFRLAVNISGRQLADPGFVPAVRRLLERYELDARTLVFELTETALAEDVPHVDRAVADLRELGITFALDDFGTGYASISYVRRFPFETLKLDRSFVGGMASSPADTALIKAAVSMGTALDMKLLAEGVETAEQAERLQELGCTAAQGFLYSRPVGAAAIRNMMRRRAGATSPGDRG